MPTLFQYTPAIVTTFPAVVDGSSPVFSAPD